MTDVKDIVKRLRGDTLDKYPGFGNLYTKAADIIETLAEEVMAARSFITVEANGTITVRHDRKANEMLDTARRATDAKIKGITL